MDWDNLMMQPVIRYADPPSIADFLLAGLGWFLALVAVLAIVWLVRFYRNV